MGAKVRTHTHISPLQISDPRLEVLENIDLTKLEDCFKLVKGADYVVHAGGRICHPSNVPTDIQVSIQNIQVTGKFPKLHHSTRKTTRETGKTTDLFQT